MHDLLASTLSRGRTIILILILIFVTGVYSYLTIPKEAQPDITIPYVYVSMHHEGISPEDAERMLVRPVEKELRGIDGLKEMSATAYEGGANVMLEFEAGLDIDPIIQDVREKVDIAKAELPEETDEPVVSEINLALEPVIVVSLSGNIPERQLLRMAKTLRDELEGISEVLEVDIGGEREEVVELVVDPTAFETYSLSLEEIAMAARRNNMLVAAGNLDSGSGRIPIKVPGLFESAEDILNLPIKTVGDTVIRTADIAQILPTFKDPMGFARLNGNPALTLYVKKRVGENVISTVDKVRATVENMRASWPEGLQVDVSFSQDQSRYIKDMLLDLQNNVISAIVLVVVVCIAALGFRNAFLVGIAIPGSFLTGILVLNIMGLTVNIIVLFSLILAVGMLVDGAIVVVEFADRKMTEGMSPPRAYLVASQRMALPIISSAATTLAAFMPLLFWPGIVGEFMKYLPITLIATLSASLVMALVFVPTVGAMFGKPGPADPRVMKSLAAAEGGDLTTLTGVTGWYVRLLARLLHHPLRLLGLTILAFILVQVAYRFFGKGVEFFPDVEPDFASVLVRMRGNLSVWEIDQKVREVESRILQVGGIKSVTARSGLSFQGDRITEDTHGLIQLEFEDWKERAPARQILKEIELRINGLSEFEFSAAPATDGFDFAVDVHTTFPIGAARIERALQGFIDRLALVQPVAASSIEAGSLLAAPGSPVTLGRMVIIPAGREATADDLRAAIQRAIAAANLPAGVSVQFIDGNTSAARPELVVTSQLRQGLREDYWILHRLDERLSREKLIRGVELLTGTNAAPAAGRHLIGRIQVRLDDTVAAAVRSWDAVAPAMQPLLTGVPGVITEQAVLEAGPPTGKDIQIELSSRNPRVLEGAVDVLRAHMESVEGLRDVDDSRPVPAVEWQIDVDRSAAARFGADINLVGSYVQFITNGLLIGTYRPDEADDEVDIRVRFPTDERHLNQIENLRVTTPYGSIPVGNFITRTPAMKVGEISRIDGRRVLTVSANVDENYLTDAKVQELAEWQRGMMLPEGLSVRFRGENEEQTESMIFLSKAFMVALFVMAIILVTQFNSLYQSFLVLTAVVFSTIGVFLGLLITGQPFGVVMNGIGVIALAGIVVNNNIVLIDTFDHHKRSGIPVMEAVLRTCAQRLRPVALTTITTALGLMPMVLRINIDFVNRDISYNAPSTQWWVQLSTSVAFGLLFATGLTLVLTPALLVLGAHARERFERRFRKHHREA